MSYYNYFPTQMPGTSTQDNRLIPCDSIEFVRSQNVRMDGQPTYYPLTNGQEIYCKKLNPVTGASSISVYKLSEDTDCIKDPLTSLREEFSELKELILENLTSPKGGTK